MDNGAAWRETDVRSKYDRRETPGRFVETGGGDRTFSAATRTSPVAPARVVYAQIVGVPHGEVRGTRLFCSTCLRAASIYITILLPTDDRHEKVLRMRPVWRGVACCCGRERQQIVRQASR